MTEGITKWQTNAQECDRLNSAMMAYYQLIQLIIVNGATRPAWLEWQLGQSDYARDP